jgi:hypothetical protein
MSGAGLLTPPSGATEELQPRASLGLRAFCGNQLDCQNPLAHPFSAALINLAAGR